MSKPLHPVKIKLKLIEDPLVLEQMPLFGQRGQLDWWDQFLLHESCPSIILESKFTTICLAENWFTTELSIFDICEWMLCVLKLYTWFIFYLGPNSKFNLVIFLKKCQCIHRGQKIQNPRGSWKGRDFYDTLGAEVPKITFSLLWPHLWMDYWADFCYGGSFLVGLHRKVVIFPFSPPHQPPRPP